MSHTQSQSEAAPVYIVTSSMLILNFFLKEHIAALKQRYQVTVVTNTDDDVLTLKSGGSVPIESVPIQREISLFADLLALLRLSLLFLRNKVGIVHSVSPKAGLIAMLAARLMRVPVRIHTFTGQVWVTQAGFRKWLLKFCDRVIARCATGIIVDSPSQREFLIAEGVLTPAQGCVLGDGSISGVDLDRFRPDEEKRERVRGAIGALDSFVFLYLGRLKRDKGIFDLVAAFRELRSDGINATLLLVGHDEEHVAESLRLEPDSGIQIHPPTDRPEDYLCAADVLCLPSYREGFGCVVIEAASAGVPSIASRIYGITDAVVEGVTGLLHRPGDVGDLKQCMRSLYDNSALRMQLALEARKRVVERFSVNRLTGALLEYYANL